MYLQETDEERECKRIRDELIWWAKNDRNHSMRTLWTTGAMEFEIKRLKIMRDRLQRR